MPRLLESPHWIETKKSDCRTHSYEVHVSSMKRSHMWGLIQRAMLNDFSVHFLVRRKYHRVVKKAPSERPVNPYHEPEEGGGRLSLPSFNSPLCSKPLIYVNWKLPYATKHSSRASCLAKTGFAAFGKGVQLIGGKPNDFQKLTSPSGILATSWE